MNRRTFLAGTGGVLLAVPLAAEAQQVGKVWRIGLLDYGSSDPARLAWWRAFQDRLRELGYADGQNVVFQARWGNGQGRVVMQPRVDGTGRFYDSSVNATYGRILAGVVGVTMMVPPGQTARLVQQPIEVLIAAA